jgi:hypothetical protein
MKNKAGSIRILLISLLFSQSLWAQSSPSEAAKEKLRMPKIEYKLLWATDTLLRNCIYSANINGKSNEKDGNGFISKISVDGKIESLKWVEGLDAPKGMGIIGNSLFVANINEIVEIDIAKATISKRYPVANSQFLNDIDVDEANNNVYVSDMATHKIHLLHNGTVTTYSADTLLDHVNGLYFHKGTLLAGTSKGVYKVFPNGKVEMFIPHTGGIDGLEYVEGNRFIVSNWAGAVHIIEAGKPDILIFDTTNDKINAADIDYIPEKQLLLVPTFLDNRAMAYKLILGN